VEGRDSAVLHNGFADQILRDVIAAGLMGENTQKMQRIGMAGVELQNLPVETFCIIEPSGLMMSHGNGEHLLNARRCLLPHKSIFPL
jgi:hypothetical protein